MRSYWHGGPRGVRRGAYILPPAITGAPSTSDHDATGIHRRDRVYLTTSKDAALLYAAGFRNGVIYECEPIGTLEPDPDCDMPGLSWQCARARVIGYIKPSAGTLKKARAEILRDASQALDQKP